MKEFTIKPKPYYYDAQIKRYLLQIAATAFAGFRVQSGKQRDGKTRFINIPVIMGTYDRVVGYIRSNENYNTAPTVPIFSLEITGMNQDSGRRRAPTFTQTDYYNERVPQKTYESNMGIEQGDTSEDVSSKGIERYMPVPYELKIKLTLWASNMDQAFQVTEQLGTVFNPELDIQVSNSPMDWSYLTVLKFDGNFDFRKTAKDIGSGGGEDDMHLVEMDFTCPVWLNPPVKVFESDAIEEIHVMLKEYDQTVSDWAAQELIDGFIIKVEE